MNVCAPSTMLSLVIEPPSSISFAPESENWMDRLSTVTKLAPLGVNGTTLMLLHLGKK